MKLSEDSSYRNEVTIRGAQLEAEFSTTPLLLDAARAIANPEKWSNVAWAVFCDDHAPGFDLDEPCHGVFEFALLKPEFQRPIGESAKSFLEDPRISKDRFTDKYHWLVLLAASFSELSDGKIEEAKTKSSTSSANTTQLAPIIPDSPSDGCKDDTDLCHGQIFPSNNGRKCSAANA